MGVQGMLSSPAGVGINLKMNLGPAAFALRKTGLQGNPSSLCSRTHHANALHATPQHAHPRATSASALRTVRTSAQAAARNVVVAADASEEAVRVFDWALNNLYREGDRLHVVHVVPDMISSAPKGFYYPQAYSSGDIEEENVCLITQAEQFIQDTIVRKAEAQGVHVNVVFVKETKHQHIGRAVCREAEKLQAEPLVLATHHKSAFAQMLLGSISKFCAAHCTRPVLLLHPEHSIISY